MYYIYCLRLWLCSRGGHFIQQYTIIFRLQYKMCILILCTYNPELLLMSMQTTVSLAVHIYVYITQTVRILVHILIHYRLGLYQIIFAWYIRYMIQHYTLKHFLLCNIHSQVQERHLLEHERRLQRRSKRKESLKVKI